MKKLLFFALLFAAGNASAQDVVKHRPYASAATNWTPGYKPSYSIEAGTWGMSSPTSFGLVADVVPVDNGVEFWVGPKAYVTISSSEKLCNMVYVAPKLNVSNGRSSVLEFGFNPNYTLTNDLLLGITVGNAVLKDTPINIFGSLGFVYLFKKNVN